MVATTMHLVLVMAPPMANPPDTNQVTAAAIPKVGSPQQSSLATSMRKTTPPVVMWPRPSHLAWVAHHNKAGHNTS